jgi:ubiquinone/menaquinone biosynthesis C-methylase UbiE
MRRLSRSDAPEWLDQANVDASLLRDNLRDIARYNALLNTHALTLRLVHELVGRAVSPPPPLSTCVRTSIRHADSPLGNTVVNRGRANSPSYNMGAQGYIGLDVGMGMGDFVRYALRAGQGHWVGLDSAWLVLQCARSEIAAPAVLAAGQQLPFADECFDVVTCAQTLHHLPPSQAIQLMHECARVARVGVVIVDLVRGYIGLVGAWLLTRLTSHNAMTRADGVQSVRRAYTPAEALALAQQAGWAGARVRRHGPIRYSLVWRTPSALVREPGEQSGSPAGLQADS